jgi:predicted N-acetyltransferase YhbS
MSFTIRRGISDDAPECGRICYSAFAAVAGGHNFLPDFPDAAVATAAIGMMLGHSGFYGVVAESDGKIVGSNFLDERNSIAGVGPITIDPEQQSRGAGARLMRAVIERSDAKGFPGIRLLQAGYNSSSLSLYSKLGFDVREHVSCIQGPAIRRPIPGCSVRPATSADLASCNALCKRVHGAERSGELRDAASQGVARVVERSGRITGYTTQIAFFGHSVGETTEDLRALISAADSFVGPGFLVPSRNGELLRWCLSEGLRIKQSFTLMTIGLYNEPVGAYLTSVSY